MAKRILVAVGVATAIVSLSSASAWAGDRLLATGGVSNVEGSAGGGLSPWALIAGYGTQEQAGAAMMLTGLRTRDGYTLRSAGAAVGLQNRLELSVAQQRFGLGDVVPGQSIDVSVVGAKLRVAGDAVYDQDSWLPQIALGVQWKRNDDFDAVPRALGARRASGVDLYAAATKLWLAGVGGRNLLTNFTLRSSSANQFGILGFGGPAGGRRVRPEASAALFVTDRIALGAEYRAKPDNLTTSLEQAAHDAFVAWWPHKNLSLTLAYVDLGSIGPKPNQKAWYGSVQLAF